MRTCKFFTFGHFFCKGKAMIRKMDKALSDYERDNDLKKFKKIVRSHEILKPDTRKYFRDNAEDYARTHGFDKTEANNYVKEYIKENMRRSFVTVEGEKDEGEDFDNEVEDEDTSEDEEDAENAEEGNNSNDDGEDAP